MRCKRRTTRLMAEQVPSQGSPKNRPPRISAPEATLLQNTTCGGSSGKEKKGTHSLGVSDMTQRSATTHGEACTSGER